MRNTTANYQLVPTFYPFLTWVKNVYSLCVEGVVTGVQSYTGSLRTTLQASTARAQLPFFTHLIPTLQPTLYTAKNRQLTPTSYHLYTLSTAPTIKKNKKK